MAQDILDPLEEYKSVYAPRFREVCSHTFDELTAEAHIDTQANKATCTELYKKEYAHNSLTDKLKRLKVLFYGLWAVVAAGLIALAVEWNEWDIWAKIGCGAVAIGIALLNLLLVHPKMKHIEEESEALQGEIDALRDKAWQQMAALNRLYNWDLFARMMTQTVPRLEFDPYFTTQRLADLKQVYGWDDSFNRERSVLYSHSGLINGNPFVLCRTRKMEWESKTYTGTKTIFWTTSERGSDGKYYTRQHSETLVATYTAPYPEYYEKVRLIFGNTAAPDLIFNRKQSGLANQDGSISYWWTKRKLKKKAEDLKGSDFAMLTNEDFEVAFDTRDRNNNQQYALLFTPLAQQNMMALLKDQTTGYGDDFDFLKQNKINTIIPQHLQNQQLDMDPAQFRHYDYEKAAKHFQTTMADYFRSIYFSLAPLLCIPIYQQIRPQHDIYGRDMMRESAFWEHESLANFWGEDKFKHPKCATHCILKTEQIPLGNGKSVIQVNAHGYQAVARRTYISKWGGDGRMHQVPVDWYEYLPVTGEGKISIQEDNDTTNAEATPKELLSHIESVLSQSNMDLYRKHIASRIR